jgi:thiopeptide-type bacteriocin biosynthesis protein
MKSEQFLGERLFTCARVLLLRSPVLPYHRVAETRARVIGSDQEESRALADYIRRLGSDPLVREAVELSSPSLGGLLARLIDGAALPKLKALRRAALSLARYQMRMSGRPTPFGLLAGVAPAWLSKKAEVRLGDAHAKAARPDMAWLMQVVWRLERHPDVLPTLHVVANGARVVRGGRVLLTFSSNGTGEGRGRPGDDLVPGTRKSGVSIRNTPVVTEMLQAAAAPIAVTSLEAHLANAFPGAPANAVRSVLEQLIEHEFLLTDLRPPLHRADPLDYVLERLAKVSELPDLEALRDIRHDIAAYSELPVGRGQTALRALQIRMRAICDVEKPLHVDLALDADICLPQELADEIEGAAAVAWRISTDERSSTPLGHYHQEFLERYGMGRAVPLLELLDPELGLDAPPGYMLPPARRRVVTPVRNEKREQLLAELAAGAIAQGHREVVLGSGTLAALSHGERAPEMVPPSSEVFVQLLSPSVEALNAGEFRVVFAYTADTTGATFGRFAHLLGEGASALAEVVRAAGTYDPLAVRANIVFQPKAARSANVAITPQWFDQRIAIAIGPDGDEDKNIPLRDLAVGATFERLYLVSRRLDREVVPTSSSMINMTGFAPNLARFLQEIGREGPRKWIPWSWGTGAQAPFLPRVRYGRSVLWSATWQLTGALRRSTSENSWRKDFEEWRALWRPPSSVVAFIGDLRIPLDLDDPLHLRILRQEAERHPELCLQEMPGGEDYPDGWLSGSAGPHRCELVVPLIRRGAAASSASQSPVFAPARSPDMDLLQPGGEWLFAKLYASPARQAEILRTYLPSALDGLLAAGEVDRWFFIRYNDPDPHLRLRFHGSPTRLWGDLLPELHDLAQRLRRDRLAARLTVDVYDPEFERYGGPEAMADAERAFAADSLASIALLQVLATADVDPVLLAAASLVDLAKTFDPPCLPGGAPRPGHTDWLAATGSRSDHMEAFRSRRQAAITLINPREGWRDLRAEPYGPGVYAAWSGRREAITRYAGLIHVLDAAGRCWTPVIRVVTSMVHMHCNRLLGTERDAEGQALAIARGALHAQRDRARFMT